MKLLIVDDERLLVKGLKFNFEQDGYEVETASDGLEAVKLAKNRITINRIKKIFSSAKAAINSDATETNTVFPVFPSPLMNERIVLVKTIQRKIIKLPLQPFDVPNIPPR